MGDSPDESQSQYVSVFTIVLLLRLFVRLVTDSCYLCNLRARSKANEARLRNEIDLVRWRRGDSVGQH